MRLLRHLVRRMHTLLIRMMLGPSLRGEYRQERVRDERAVEYAFALKHVARLYPSSILEVGPGKTAFPHILWTCGFKVTAIDKDDDPWSGLLRRGSLYNRHYYVMKDDITSPALRAKFDVITCISVLEHIPDHDLAVRMMFNLLEPNGHLILTCPYNESAGVARLSDLPDFRGGSYGDFTGVLSRSDVDRWLGQSQWEVAAQEYYQLTDGEYYGMGAAIIPPHLTGSTQSHQLTCMVLRKLS